MLREFEVYIATYNKVINVIAENMDDYADNEEFNTCAE